MRNARPATVPQSPSAEKKPVRWVGSCLRDLTAMPEDIKDSFGKALLQAQYGGRAANTKLLRGFGGASVLEIKDDEDGSTYRLVYTVRHPNYIYALHAFQKKSHHGSETSQSDIDLIQVRLAAADNDYKETFTAGTDLRRKGEITTWKSTRTTQY